MAAWYALTQLLAGVAYLHIILQLISNAANVKKDAATVKMRLPVINAAAFIINIHIIQGLNVLAVLIIAQFASGIQCASFMMLFLILTSNMMLKPPAWNYPYAKNAILPALSAWMGISYIL
jgi:hypothetical protein